MDHPGGYRVHVADLYDHVVPYRNRADIAFYVEAAVESGGPVLEVGCGTGRVLIPTARAGIDIVGLDASPHMLDLCRQNLLHEPEGVQSKVRLVEADMRDFRLGETFALATLPFRPFQHMLTVADQIACLESVHGHLAEGGSLILDMFNPSLEHLVRVNVGEEFGEEPAFVMPDGRRVVRRHKIVARDLHNQTSQIELIYDITHPDGREEQLIHEFAMRYLFRFEAEHLLARCGFQVEHVYADFENSPYGSKSPGELVFVARRAARVAHSL